MAAACVPRSSHHVSCPFGGGRGFPNLVPQRLLETMHRMGTTGESQVAVALEGRVDRERFPEEESQEGDGHTLGASTDHPP